MTKICVTGVETDLEELTKRLQYVFSRNPEVICEIRMDYIGLSPADSLRYLRSLPPKWACRSILTQRLALTNEFGQGHCQWNVSQWQEWWYEVLATQKWFAADIDWVLLDRIKAESIKWDLSKFHGQSIFFSYHGSLREFLLISNQFFDFVWRYGAGQKIAIAINDPSELKTFIDLRKRLTSNRPSILIPMGGIGRAIRFSSITGDWTYVAMNDQAMTSPGQVHWDLVHRFSNGLPEKKFVLLSNAPENKIGESSWNAFFERQNINALYLNLAFPKAHENHLLDGLRLSGVNGASVTMPHKNSFPTLAQKCLGRQQPINTISIGRSLSTTQCTNTDGTAVFRTIHKYFKNKKPNRVLIVGGGGAATGVEAFLKSKRIVVEKWERKSKGALYNKVLPRLLKNDYDVLISTWPLSETKKLTKALDQNSSKLRKVKLVVDAALVLKGKRSSLEAWAWEKKLNYYSGMEWWQGQAQEQMRFWKFDHVIKQSLAASANYIPSSKSHLIRQLFIATLMPQKIQIKTENFSLDVEQMIEGLRSLGASIRTQSTYIFIGKEALDLSRSLTIHIKGSATAFRFLASLLHWKQATNIALDADFELRDRIDRDTWAKSILTNNDWPKRVRENAVKIKRSDYSAQSTQTSQYHSGYAICAATDLEKVGLYIDQGFPSKSYFQLTIETLKEFGFSVNRRGRKLSFKKTRDKKQKNITTSLDVSSLAYLEVASQYLGLTSYEKILGKELKEAKKLQGDSAIFSLLKRMQIDSKLEIDAQNFPDLVPTIFAAAVLFSVDIFIDGVEILKFKESDRIRAIQEVAKLIGVEFDYDGSSQISVYAKNCRGPNPRGKPETILRSQSDHRISMMIGLLSLRWPQVAPDDKDCVAKSFPGFWEALKEIKGARP